MSLTRLPIRRLLVIVFGVVAGARAASGSTSIAAQVAPYYAPFRVQKAALAPDGRHVAFTVFRDRQVDIVIADVDDPEARLTVPFENRREAETKFLVWTSAERLIAVSDTTAIMSVALPNGTTQRFAPVAPDPSRPDTPGFAGPAARVLGFAPDDPDSVFLETITPEQRNESPDPAGSAATRSNLQLVRNVVLEALRLNLRTGERTTLLERTLPAPGGSVILDRQGTPRLVLTRGAEVRRFDYRAPNATSAGWQDLDAVLPDRKVFAFTVTPENFAGTRSIPLGFAIDPNVLYYASNLGRDTFAIYAIDFRTGRRMAGGIEDADVDLVSPEAPWENSPLVFDRKSKLLAGVRRSGPTPATRWLDGDLGAVEAALGEKFPGRNVELLDWDEAHDRFVVLVSQPGDPGRYFVFRRPENRCDEYFRRTRALAPEALHHVETFSFTTPAGARIGGTITAPRNPPVAKPALVVWLRDVVAPEPAPSFDRDAQALAALGFFVAQIDYTGSPGQGLARREALRHDLDRGRVAEILAAVGWLTQRHQVDPKRAAIIGEGFGGYLALRAVQLQPDAFRCAAVVDAVPDLGDLVHPAFRVPEAFRNLNPFDTPSARAGASDVMGFSQAWIEAQQLERRMGGSTQKGEDNSQDLDFEARYRTWMMSGGPRLADIAVTQHPELLTKPLLFLHHATNRLRAPASTVQRLYADMARHRLSASFVAPPASAALTAADARARTLQQIGEFLNAELYDFGVKIGIAVEKP